MSSVLLDGDPELRLCWHVVTPGGVTGGLLVEDRSVLVVDCPVDDSLEDVIE